MVNEAEWELWFQASVLANPETIVRTILGILDHRAKDLTDQLEGLEAALCEDAFSGSRAGNVDRSGRSQFGMTCLCR